jgi:calcineurin-like phosphoesterase family protein
MSVYFCGDPHLGHRNIAKFRPFVDSTEHNTKLFVDSWRKTIKKNDIVYFMGDAAFDKESLDLIGNLHARKILIKGNHDDMVSSKDQAAVFEEIHGMLKYKGMWLVHAPLHPDEIRGRKGVVHGHVHNQSIMKKTWYGTKVLDKRYFNTCVDVIYPKTKSMFISLDDIKTYFG